MASLAPASSPGLAITKNSIAGTCPGQQHARARRRRDIGDLELGRVETVLGHEAFDHLRGEAAGAAPQREPFELLRLGDIGAVAQAEDGIRRLLIVDRRPC